MIGHLRCQNHELPQLRNNLCSLMSFLAYCLILLQLKSPTGGSLLRGQVGERAVTVAAGMAVRAVLEP